MTIFVPPKDIEKRKGIRLSDEKSHYLLSVLRRNKGDVISVIDGKGKTYEAEVSEISKKNVFIDIFREIQLDRESILNLVLCQGILKGEKMDFVIQKAAELGVKEIIPLITERCLVKETRKVKRWQKIAEESAEQCGRAVIPLIHEPVDIRALHTVYNEEKMNGFIFWEEGGLFLREAFSKLALFNLSFAPVFIIIGPEGGFTKEEVNRAEKYGLIRTTLGKRILRAETAAIVSIALVQFLGEE
jgi:16S rRNA (uracil1498-N3)-methyltransferase